MDYQDDLARRMNDIIKQAEELRKQGALREDLARIDAELKKWRDEIFARTPNHQEFSEEETNKITELVEEW